MKKVLLIFLNFNILFANALDFRTIQSDFTQVLHSKGTEVKYDGKFYATDENKALWVYTKPVKKEIYFNQTRVVIIEDELEQAIISNLQDVVNLGQILSNAKQITPALYKTTFDGVDYLITLKNNVISTIDYKDKLENKIKIKLRNVVLNKEISDEKFYPKIPSTYDIIRQ